MAVRSAESTLIRPGVYPFLDVPKERGRPPLAFNYPIAALDESADRSFTLYCGMRGFGVDQSLKKVVFQRTRNLSTNTAYSVITGVPIAVATERSEWVEPTIASLVRAGEKVNDALLLVNLNYSGDMRNDGSILSELRAQAERMQRDIINMVPSKGNTGLLIVRDYKPSGATWPHIRKVMSDTALAFTSQHYSVVGGNHEKKQSRRHNTPYLQVDADTTVSEEAFIAVENILGKDKAVFVNGTMHYTGGIMDKPLIEVARQDTTTKLLYFAEMMRRRMFDPLPPISLRGYLPDFGLGVKLGVIPTLNGFEDHSPQNESFFLQVKAIEALREHWPTKMKERVYPDAVIDSSIASRIEGLVYYVPYDEMNASGYLVESSIRGLEANIRQYGRHGLLAWDQGRGYKAWNDYQESPSSILKEPELTLEQVYPLANAIYSSFKDFGGKLPQEDGHADRPVSQLQNVPVHEMNLQELLNFLFAHPEKPDEKVIYHRFVAIAENERSKLFRFR